MTKIILKSLILFSVETVFNFPFQKQKPCMAFASSLSSPISVSLLSPPLNFHLLIPITFLPFSIFCFSLFPSFNFYPDFPFTPTFFFLSFPFCSSYFSCISGCWLFFFFGGFLLVPLFPFPIFTAFSTFISCCAFPTCFAPPVPFVLNAFRPLPPAPPLPPSPYFFLP